ncbi:MAG: ABC transporter substrate-binding protein [Thermomicrobiales bacterium]
MNDAVKKRFAAATTRRRLLQGASALAAFGGLGPVAIRPALAQDAPANEVRMLVRKPDTLNPFFSTSGNEQQIERLVMGALVKSDDKLQPVADLAESFEGSEDALTYTFKLRPGLVFNDGEPLTSRDVAFTIERAVDKKTGSVWQGRLLALAGAQDYADGKADTISGVETPDDLTIKLTLAAPDGTFLLTLADYSGLGIMPEHALKDLPPDQMQTKTYLEPEVTAGAFNLVRYEPDQFIELQRSETYSPMQPALERILLPIRTPEVALGEMETGDLDIMNLPLAEVDSVDGMAGVSLVAVQSPSMDHIILNHQRPFLQDKRLRQAMMYAIDRKTIVEELLQGRGEVVNSPIFGPDWMGIPEGLNTYDYNPDQARALLQEMGWDANQKIVSMTVTPGEWWGEIVAQQINDVGIKFEIQQVEVSQLIDAILAENADFDSFLNGGDTYRADPNISSLFYSTSQFAPAGGNFCRYSNSDLDQLYVEGRATNDLAKRKEIYTKAAKILNDDVPAIFLWSPNSFFAVNDRVQGFKGPGYVDNRLWNAEDWTVTG